MLLQITPKGEIEFPLQANAPPHSRLKLTNVSSNPVAFKIKVTAPKRYIVKPSSGSIAASDEMQIEITLQPQSPAADPKDKFLVQATTYLDAGPVTKEFWSEVDKSNIEETKLSVADKGPMGTSAEKGPYGDTSSKSKQERVGADYTAALVNTKRDLLAQIDEARQERAKLLQGTTPPEKFPYLSWILFVLIAVAIACVYK
eukprot:GHVN01056803.1.p1 GENE.GHVN01056803.1~~GHVN01056803.1.p1  ORF type:complete len:223 (+),score=28.62 GHVN01056803.1:68-670(+)